MSLLLLFRPTSIAAAPGDPDLFSEQVTINVATDTASIRGETETVTIVRR